MKVIFMGTPEFSVPTLEYLIKQHDVKAIFTQPDRQRGRGNRLSFSHVKEYALNYDIKIYQPEKIKSEEIIDIIKKINPDVIIVIAYGQILSKEILEIPKYGCINVHASLLPELRGASPINTAIVKGLKETGITTMQMSLGLDTGDILVKESTEILDSDNASDLHDKLMNMAPSILDYTLKNIDNIIPIKQDDSKATYAPIIKKEMAKIYWDMKAKDIHNLIRGYNPWPVAFTIYDNVAIKIYRSKVENFKTDKVPGTVVGFNKEGLKVQTGDYVITILELQVPGKNRLNISQFALGHKIKINSILGE